MRNDIARALAPLVLAVPLGSWRCTGDITSPQGEAHKCQVWTFPDGKWPQNGALEVDKPTQCPVTVAYSRQIPFSGDGVFYFGDISAFPSLRTDFVNDLGYPIGTILNGTWVQSGFDQFVTVTGGYVIAGVNLGADIHADTAHFALALRSNEIAFAWADLTYRSGSENFGYVVAPSDLMPHTSYTIEGRISDPEAIGPLSWRWWDNGVEIGVDNITVPRNSGEMGENHDYYFEATDQGNGHVTSGSGHVHTKNCDTPGCADMTKLLPLPNSLRRTNR